MWGSNKLWVEWFWCLNKHCLYWICNSWSPCKCVLHEIQCTIKINSIGCKIARLPMLEWLRVLRGDHRFCYYSFFFFLIFTSDRIFSRQIIRHTSFATNTNWIKINKPQDCPVNCSVWFWAQKPTIQFIKLF